jgi:hypothetical protein
VTPEQAARVLGVAAGAGRRDVLAAFRRVARQTHPDRPGGDPEAFEQAVAARDVLLSTPVAPPEPTPGPAPRRRADGWDPRPQSLGLIAVWVALLAVAAFLAIFRVDHPFGLVEPIIRWAVLAAAGAVFAATGRRAALVVMLLAAVASVAMTIVETTLGGLLGLLAAVPALYGMALSGVARARQRSSAV